MPVVDAVVYIIDVADRERFSEARAELDVSVVLLLLWTASNFANWKVSAVYGRAFLDSFFDLG